MVEAETVGKMRPGMTLEERQQARQFYEERAIEQARTEAKRLTRSLVCGGYHFPDTPENHARCKGEKAGNPGCLCECHDPKPAGDGRG